MKMFEYETTVPTTLSGSEESDVSDVEDSEEMIEVTDGTQTLYFQSKDGMAQCQFCGKFGVRDAFYSKTKEFCSVACSRNFTNAVKDGKPIPKQLGISPVQIKTTLKPKPPKPVKVETPELPPITTVPAVASVQFKWDEYLDKGGCQAAPINSFKHAPMAEASHGITSAMRVEVVNTESDMNGTVYWVASVVRVAGYKALLRYEGFGADSSRDFWANWCSDSTTTTDGIHHIGWCAQSNKLLVPPIQIQDRHADWRAYLMKQLVGAFTLPKDFHEKTKQQLNSCPLKVGMKVEVIDKMCVSAMRVARVDQILSGRIKLKYESSMYDDDTFWCHHLSPLVHPVGWSQKVGHTIKASQSYKTASLQKYLSNKYNDDEAGPDLFPKLPEAPSESQVPQFAAGVKLEAIDPLNLSCICVATVMKVLEDNYLMVGIDGSMASDGSDWFCYHAYSPYIFPVGFCEVNGLELTPPRNHKGKFSWVEYLKQTKAIAAPVPCFNREIVSHGFRSGMRLEAADLMDPRLICVASVYKVVGRLLRVHFDGWDQTYDQWMDCVSADIYPVGWCELSGCHLEGPRGHVAAARQPGKRKKSKPQAIKGGARKKRKSKSGKPILSSQGSLDLSEVSQDSMTSDPSTPHLLAPSSTPSGVVTAANIPPGQTVLVSASAVPHTTGTHQASGGHKGGESLLISHPGQSTTVQGRSVMSSIPRVMASTSTLGRVAPYIPRIVTGGGDAEPGTLVVLGPTGNKEPTITPLSWSVNDVCQFLKVNDCAMHCETFKRLSINGEKLMNLSKETLASQNCMKVGQSLRIYELIQALKMRITAQNKM